MMTGDSDRPLISSLLPSEEEEKAEEVQVETDPIDRPPATASTISSPRIMEEDDDDGSGNEEDEDHDEGIVLPPPPRTPTTPTSSYYHLYAASNTPQQSAATNSEWTVQQSMQQRGHAAVTDDSDGTLRRGSHALTNNSSENNENDNDAEESENLRTPIRAVAGTSETNAATTSETSAQPSINEDDEGGAGNVQPSSSTRAVSLNLSEASSSSEINTTTHRPGRGEEEISNPKAAKLSTASIANPNASPAASTGTSAPAANLSRRDPVRTSEAKKSKIVLRVILGAFMFGLFGAFVRIPYRARV
jgi:hypothetical protein